jgi:hypothetical protein
MISQIVVLREINENLMKVKYQNIEYDAFKSEKEYNGMEYDDNQVFSELILAPILLNPLS